jgi:hypothetical protein
MRDAMNVLGAVTGLTYYFSCILLFLFRIAGQRAIERPLGFAQIAFAAPLVLLLVTAPRFERLPLYYVQALLLLAFVAFEAVVDTILRVDFRSTRWAVILYVMFFFAATGGMLGVVSLAGPAWLIAGAAAFLAMGGLAFVQRGVTGL